MGEYYEMSEYTAEDFEKASFARHPGIGATACRMAGAKGGPAWTTDDLSETTDEIMAASGWVPVVEADGPAVTEGTLRDLQEKAERKRQKLIAHVARVEAAVRDRNRTIEELYVARQEASRRESAAHDRVVTLLDTKKTHERTVHELRHDLKVALAEVAELGDENDRLGRALQAPLTLDALEAAWEAAEQADECREGDVLIIRDDEDNYLVRRMEDRNRLDSTARILSRAPKREPWADLADVLRGTVWERLSGDVDGLAAAVHAAGWRKGGEES